MLEVEKQKMKLEKQMALKQEQLQKNSGLAKAAEDKGVKKWYVEQAEKISKEITNLSLDIAKVNDEIVYEKSLREFDDANLKAEEKESVAKINKEKTVKENDGLKTTMFKTKTFNIFNNKKDVRNIEVTAPQNYDAIEETLIFLKGIAENDMRGFRKYKEKFSKSVNYHAYYSTQDTAASDLAGTTPGYHLEAGDTAITHDNAPLLLVGLIEQNIYANSRLLWLTGGWTQRRTDELVYLLDEMTGLDGVAEGEIKPDLNADLMSIRTSLKKVAGKIIYSEEMMRFDRINYTLIEQFAARFARAVYKKMDKDLISATGGDNIVGLNDPKRGQAPTGKGTMLLAPQQELALNVGDVRKAFTKRNWDIVDRGTSVRAVIHPEYSDLLFELNPTTGGTDKVVATENASTGIITYRGIQIAQSENMFSTKATDGVIGVINLGGLEAITDRASNPFTFKQDPYTLMDRNLYRMIGEIFYDVLVVNKELVVLIKDNFTGLVTNVASTGATNLTADVATFNKTPIDGETFTVVKQDANSTYLGKATASAGKLTFTLTGGTTADKVNIVNSRGDVVATGTLG